MFFSPRFVALLFLIGAVLPSTAQAAWTEPTASPPGGNVAAPLNVSDNDQTKVGGSLTVQVGGVAGRTPDDTWSIQGVAPNAAGGAAMGVLGTGSDAAGGTSAGVYGISYQGNGTGLRVGLMGVAGFNSSNSYGVYGYDGSQFGMNNAYAGYFRGRTGVEGEICLNGDCIADWTQIGGGLFTHDQLRNITYRTDTNANIALGGTDDSNAAFFFNVSPAANRGIFVAEKSITIGPDVGSAGNNGICTSPPETCSDQDCWGRQDGCDFDEICNPNGDGSCIQTDNTPPTAPGNLRLNGQAGSDNVPLMWDASNDGGGSGVAGYRIFRCQGVGCTPTVQLQQIGNQTTYTDTTVSPSTTYNYHVTAFDNQNNESGPSNVLEVVTPAGGGDTTAPSIPENLRTNGTVLSNLVPLAWDPSFDEPGGSGMAGYKLYRCSVSPTCNPTLYQTLGLVTNFDDTGVSRNTLYIYYVTAFDGANNESDPSNWWPVYTPQGGSSPVILKDEDPVPPPPPGALLEEANRNIARRLRERSQPVEEPVIGGVRPLSRLLGVPTAQAKFNLFSIPTANAGPPFDALDNVRLTVNNGVIQIVTGPPVQVMEIGYGSSDIASTTDIILRPGTRSQAQGARFFQSGNDTALRLTSHVTVGDSGTTDAGSVRYNSGDLQGYVAGQWVSLTNHGTGGVVLSADQVIWNATATNPLGTFPQDASIDVASAISGRTLYGDPIYTQGVVTDATFAVPGTGPSAHRVGIGTITPNALLEVQNDDEFVPATIRLTNTFSTPGIWELQSRQNPSPALNNAFVIWGGSQGAEDFRLTIDRDGDVGIGTGQTDPLARLHVVGTAKIGSATTSNDLIIGRSAVATGTTPQSDICFTKADGVLECINEWSDLTGFGVGGIQGSGTANFVPRFVTPTTIGDSVIFQDVGANIGINRSAGLAARLDVQGSIRARGQLYVDPNDNGTPDLFVDSAAGQTRVSVGSAVATAALLTVDNGSIWARGAEGDIVIGGTLTAIGQTAGTPELCFQGSCIDAFNDLILNTAAFGVIAQPGGFYVAGNGRVGGTLTVDQGPLQLPTSNRTTYDTRFERNSGSLDGYNISTKLVFGAASNQWGLGIFSDENLNVPIVTITEDRKVHLGSAANPTDLCLYGPGGPGCRSDWPEQSGGVVTAADQVIWNATATNPLGGFPQPASIKVGSAIMGESFYGGPTYDINGAVAAATFAVTSSGVNGKVGIGTHAPSSLLHIAQDTSPLDILATQASSAPAGVRVAYRKARGTNAVPLVAQAGDSVAEIYADVYDSNSYEQAASIRFTVDGGVSDNIVPGRITFWNRSQAIGAVPRETVRISSSGQVGINTTTPANQIDIKGSAAIGQYAGVNAASTDGLIVSGHVGIGTNDAATPYTLAVKTPERFGTVFANDGASTYVDFTAEAATSFGNSFAFFTDGDDILYLGRSSEFGAISFDFATPGAGITRIVEYWNGTAWAALAITDGTNNLTQDGTMTYTIPLNWVTNTVNGVSRNWVRIRTTTAPTIVPTAFIVTPEAADRLGVFAASGDTNPTLVVDQRGTVAIGGNAGGTKLTVMGGSVGIGTLTPSQQLSVSGNISTIGSYYQGAVQGISQLATCAGDDVVGSLDVRGGIVTALTCEPDDTGIGGSGLANYIPRFLTATTIGTSNIFQNINNIGIGTTTPTSFFSVGGSSQFQVNVTGNLVKVNNVTYNWPSAAPTAGTYLGSDGSGNLSWTVPAGGGGGIVTAADQVIWNATAANPLGGFPQPASIKVGSAIMGESFYGGPTYDINGAVAAATFAVTSSGVNGKVGIGTIAPVSTLDVAGGLSIGAYAGVDAPEQNGMIISGHVGIGTNDTVSSPSYTLAVNTPERFDGVFFFDGAVFQNTTIEARTSYGTPYNVLVDLADIFYAGRNTKFTAVGFDFATPGAGLTRAVEYWNGTTWTALGHFDTTNNLSQDGAFTFVAPANWATTAVNGQTRYWVRVRTTTNPTTAPTAYSTTPEGAERIGAFAQYSDTTPTFVVDRRGLVRIGGNSGPTKLTVSGGDVLIGDTEPAAANFWFRPNDTGGNPSLEIRDTNSIYGGSIIIRGRDTAGAQEYLANRIRWGTVGAAGSANLYLAMYYGCSDPANANLGCATEAYRIQKGFQQLNYADGSEAVGISDTYSRLNYIGGGNSGPFLELTGGHAYFDMGTSESSIIYFRDNENQTIGVIREDDEFTRSPEFGIGTGDPQGPLVVKSGSPSWNPTGQRENAISAFADSSTGSAVYGQQTQPTSYAGYFSGKTNISGALEIHGTQQAGAPSQKTPNANTDSLPTLQGVPPSIAGNGLSMVIGMDGLPRILAAHIVGGNETLSLLKCGDASCGSVTETVLETTVSGAHLDSTIDIGVDGYPIVSFFNFAANQLRLFDCGDPDCGSFTSTIVAAGAMRHPSYILRPNGLPIMSYSQGGGSLNTFVKACANQSCSAGTTTQITNVNGGGDTAIAIGSDGLPVIAYHVWNHAGVLFTRCTNADCTSFSAPINLDNTVGTTTLITELSMTIGDDGLPIISYYHFANTDLRVIHCGTIDCTAGSAIRTIDATGDVGQESSIAIGTDGKPIVAYRDGTNNALKVAHCGEITCNTAAGGGLSVVTVAPGPNTEGKQPSITIGANGLPVIAYFDSAPGNVRVARCSSVNCLPFWTRQ